MKSHVKLKSSFIGLVLTASAFNMQPALSNPLSALFQNPLIWLGTPNPSPPPAISLWEFQPLSSLPAFSSPNFGWFKNFEFESCVLGLSSTSSIVGPYGTAHNLSVNGCDSFSSTSSTTQNPAGDAPTGTTPTGDAAGGEGATNAATGGLSNTAIVGGALAVGAAVAIGLSGGDGSTGTTGTGGTTGR